MDSEKDATDKAATGVPGPGDSPLAERLPEDGGRTPEFASKPEDEPSLTGADPHAEGDRADVPAGVGKQAQDDDAGRGTDPAAAGEFTAGIPPQAGTRTLWPKFAGDEDRADAPGPEVPTDAPAQDADKADAPDEGQPPEPAEGRRPPPKAWNLGDLLFRPTPIVCVEPVTRLFWPLLALAAAARIAVALVGDFILHPDELYQYLEPAHGIVFGNAITVWEFVFGARPFHIAGFVAGILFVLDFLGLGDPDHYIPTVKVVFCLVSLILPVSMYFLARSLWGERTAFIAFLFGCFWYEFVGFAHKPLSDMVSAYLIMGGMALMASRNPGTLHIAAGTLLFAMAFGVRYQTVMLTGFFCLFLLAHYTPRQVATLFVSGGAAFLAVGYLDHLAWGGFYHSILTNLAVNIELHREGDPGGQASDIHFFLWFAWASAGAAWVTVGVALLTGPRRYVLPLVLLLAFFLSHSLLVHKEYRFAFPWIALWILVASDLVARALGALKERPRARALAGSSAAALFAGISVAGIANSLPAQEDLYLGYSNEHTLVSFLTRDPHLQIYRRLGKDRDLKALLENARPLSSSGGYYYLHKKVPLYGPDYLIELAIRLDRETEQPQWYSHVITPASQYGGDQYELEEKVGNLLVWKVKPEDRRQVFTFDTYRFSPDMERVLEGLPALWRLLPKDADYSVRLHEPDRWLLPPPKKEGP